MGRVRFLDTRSTGGILRDLIPQDEWWVAGSQGAWDETTAGSGSIFQLAREFLLDTGATASSRAQVTTRIASGWSAGKAPQVIDWDKRIVWEITLNHVNQAALGDFWAIFGSDGTTAEPDYKSIGFYIDNLVLSGFVHDGTTYEATSLSTTLTADVVYRLTVTSDGLGNVEWFVDGVSKGTDDGAPAGPVGDAVDSDSAMHFEVVNNGTAGSHRVDVHGTRIYVEQ